MVKKRNILGVVLTSLVIALTILSGPVNAINVNLTTPDIDVSTNPTQTFTIEVEINDGEFLPLILTDIVLDNNEGYSQTCMIDHIDNSVKEAHSCDYLTVVSKEISGLNFGYGYGYGYGYDSNTLQLGYQDFGYGYGYGYGSRGDITGLQGGAITYTLEVNTAKLPSNLIGKTVNAEARVFGGDEFPFSQDSSIAFFSGKSSFKVEQSNANVDQEEVLAIKEALTEELILNGNKDANDVISDLYLPTFFPGTTATGTTVAISWSSSNNAVSSTGKVTRDPSADITTVLTATIQKGIYSETKEFTVIVKQKVAPATVDPDGKIDAGANTEIVLDNSNIGNLKEIEIPETVSEDEEVALNLGAIIGNDKKLTLGANDLTLSRNSNTGVTYSVEIPSGTIIQGEANWNGLITVPTVKPVSEVSVADGTPDLVIEVGSSSVKLTFDKAVKLTLPGKAGKAAGYVGNDDVFNPINACTASEIADPDTLQAESECSTTSGNDMVIWTKHFTKFVSYSQGSPSPSSSGGSSRDGGRFIPGVGAVTPSETTEEAIEEVVEEQPEIQEEIPAPITETIVQPEEEEQGFFDALTGAVIGGGAFKGLSGVIIGLIVIVAIVAGYYRIVIRRRKK